MELRESGRDLVQINDDGTHAILPVAMHFRCTLDHARMPVMWLRRSDGKLRRDGSRAVSQQPDTPSVSAEDCTAHRDSLLSTGVAFWRASEGLVVEQKGRENGRGQADEATD